MLIGMGETLSAVATPGPTMPANVAAANQITSQQPYWNQIISLSQNPLANANAATNTLTPSQVSASISMAVQQYKSAPAALQAQTLQQFEALWQFMPTFLQNAPIVDAWSQQNGL